MPVNLGFTHQCGLDTQQGSPSREDTYSKMTLGLFQEVTAGQHGQPHRGVLWLVVFTSMPAAQPLLP